MAAATKPSVASKPAFTPTQSTGGSTGYNPLANRAAKKIDSNVDEDGWGQDAPPVTRSQLEKVQSAYKPTQVNMRELTSQKSATSTFGNDSSSQDSAPGVIRGAYQPVGKVDIAAIRRQAKESGNAGDDRPEIVKGSYEPIGRVDIAAIRAKAQKPDAAPAPITQSTTGQSQGSEEPVPSLAQRSAAFSSGPERLTSLPKPKVANKFGGASNFSGTKAPLPGGFESKTVAPAAPVGTASRTFADQGGKTPAQIWAEKKARERGASGSGGALPPSNMGATSPVTQQKSGGQWESGYSGKKWGSVQTNTTGRSRGESIGAQQTGEAEPIPERDEEDEVAPSGGIGSIRDRFAGAAPMGAPAATGYDRPTPPTAPEPETSTKPNRGVPIPGMLPRAAVDEDETPSAPRLPSPPPQPRSPTPPTPEARDISPIRVAIPVRKTEVADVHEEQYSPEPAMPTRSLDRMASQDDDDEPETGPDPGRAAAQNAATTSLGHEAAEPAPTGGASERAKAEYDYDAAEDNEVSLREGKATQN